MSRANLISARAIQLARITLVGERRNPDSCGKPRVFIPDKALRKLNGSIIFLKKLDTRTKTAYNYTILKISLSFILIS